MSPKAVVKLLPGQFTLAPPKDKRAEAHVWRMDLKSGAKYVWAARTHEEMQGWKEALW